MNNHPYLGGWLDAESTSISVPDAIGSLPLIATHAGTVDSEHQLVWETMAREL